MAASGMTIGEASRRSGCSVETIRYYERLGLLPPPARRGRYRLFGAEEVRRLAFIRRARALGFSLEDVHALLRIAAEEGKACADARERAARHLRDVRARVRDLRAMERALAEAIRRCDAAGADPACPLLAMLSEGAPTARGRRRAEAGAAAAVRPSRPGLGAG
jgi:MerR family mercuric resistance operon transcriptional regulator